MKFQHLYNTSFVMSYTKPDGTNQMVTFESGANVPFKSTATLVTEDPDLIDYIKNRSDYGTMIAEVVKAEPTNETKPPVEDKEFPEVVNGQQAKDVLNKQFNIPHSKLGNKKDILAAALTVNVKFPNLPTE